MRACFQLMDDRFMRNKSIKSGRLAVIGAVVAFATASLAPASLVLAQDNEASKHRGAVVSVTGNGDSVKAFGARVSVDGATTRVKAAGAVVDVRGAVEGSLWAAGADVTVAAQTGGDVRAAGAHVVVRGRIAGNVKAAGAVLDLNLATESNLSAAGASVHIGSFTDVGGNLRAAGASIVFDGRVDGGAEFAGAVVTFNGSSNGSVSVHAESLIVGPEAVIGGDLVVRSLAQPQIDPGASIAGAVVLAGPGEWFDDMPEMSLPIIGLAFAAAAFVIGLIFLIFARNSFGEAVDHVRFRPISSVLYGILSLVVLAVVASVLMGTVVGLGLGIALLLLLPIIFVLGYAVAATGIVGWLFGRSVPRLGAGRLLLFLIIGSLAIGFAGIIPFTGPGIVLFLLIFGVGGFLRAVLWRFRTSRDSGPREAPARPKKSAPVLKPREAPGEKKTEAKPIVTEKPDGAEAQETSEAKGAEDGQETR
jgi:cytoskeletal protein CcmA (bactofilin family)